MLYYQQLSIGRYQVSFYANSYFLVITNSVQFLQQLYGFFDTEKEH